MISFRAEGLALGTIVTEGALVVCKYPLKFSVLSSLGPASWVASSVISCQLAGNAYANEKGPKIWLEKNLTQFKRAKNVVGLSSENSSSVISSKPKPFSESSKGSTPTGTGL